MAEVPLVKITEPDAARLCRVAKPADEAVALLVPGDTTQAWIERLMASGEHAGAARVLAFALPPREAVWWACLCARTATDEVSPPEVVAALDAAEAWAFEPTEERRRAAEAAGMADDATSHPAGWAALGAFWSGGSISTPDNPAVPAGPYHTATAVATAVVLAAYAEPAEQADARWPSFLAWGLDIAAGGTGGVA